MNDASLLNETTFSFQSIHNIIITIFHIAPFIIRHRTIEVSTQVNWTRHFATQFHNTISNTNTIIILTSNLGSQYLLDGIGPDGEITADAREHVQGELRRAFRPEFLNRLDEILMFRPLTRDNLSHIIDNLVAGLRSRLADRTLNLEMTDAAKALIIQNGYDPAYGARPLKRYLQSHAETLIARTILSGDLHAGDTLVVDAENGALVCRVKA